MLTSGHERDAQIEYQDHATLTPKFGKSTDFVIKLPICQNYVEIGLYGQDSGSNKARCGKCMKLPV
jgi:hypothetical protein